MRNRRAFLALVPWIVAIPAPTLARPPNVAPLAAPANPGAGRPESEPDRGGGSPANGQKDHPIGRSPFAQVGLGFYAGLILPSPNHDFHGPSREQKKLASPASVFGLRGGVRMLGILGMEIEGALVPMETIDVEGATGAAVRGNGVIGLPLRRWSPFLVGGGGAMAVFCESLGDDVDPVFYFGGGLELALGWRIAARVDLRDNLTPRHGAEAGAFSHQPELLLGFGMRSPRVRSPVAPAADLDLDADGVVGGDDDCPERTGFGPGGCPAPDLDHDGSADVHDQCPTVRGVLPFGCPAIDSDGDGFFDDSDPCPHGPGVPPEPCPADDTDEGPAGEPSVFPPDPPGAPITLPTATAPLETHPCMARMGFQRRLWRDLLRVRCSRSLILRSNQPDCCSSEGRPGATQGGSLGSLGE
ncbi:MAG: hypothetical protein JW751_10665 [Polyangiaceae bacterium]|nr:hypothetical protein [Polyangiaceae bacterium]